VDLSDDPLAADLRGARGTDFHARRTLAVHAEDGHEVQSGPRSMFPFPERSETNPGDPTPARGVVLVRRRNVVFRLAGHHARLTGGAAVEVDDHSPARHAISLTRTLADPKSGSDEKRSRCPSRSC